MSNFLPNLLLFQQLLILILLPKVSMILLVVQNNTLASIVDTLDSSLDTLGNSFQYSCWVLNQQFKAAEVYKRQKNSSGQHYCKFIQENWQKLLTSYISLSVFILCNQQPELHKFTRKSRLLICNILSTRAWLFVVVNTSSGSESLENISNCFITFDLFIISIRKIHVKFSNYLFSLVWDIYL